MGAKAWTVILCAAAAAACAPKDEGLAVARLPDGAYRLTLKAPDLTDAAQGQRLLLPAALQLCGAGEIRFGTYEFAREATPPQLVQDLRCIPPPLVETASAGDAFAPTEADERAIAELSDRFLDARDAGDVAAAQALFDPRSADGPTSAWRAEVDAFNRLAGAETKRATSKISWFENPPAAPAPGVYAAVDYVRAFENVKTACGFIVWRRQADGGWRIDREQLSYLDPAAEARTRRSDLPEVRARLGCR
jgi:hypothetical protein